VFLFIIFSCVIIFSCDKLYENNYEISFCDFEPDIIVTSVRDSGYLRWDQADGPCDYPIPTDSLAYYNLDLNGDSILDFKIVHTHYFQWLSVHLYCGLFVHCSSITALNSNNSIIINPDQGKDHLTKLFNIGDTIYPYLKSQKQAAIYYYNLDAFNENENFTPAGDFYIGIQLSNSKQYNNYNIGYLHIDINRDRIMIKDFAYIYIKNQFIIAGQMD
jgi:hypothetical protein